ncbi:putative glutathione synthase [Rosa chinensis]|uniref:Putative glutathione synthase n=1 Tax=Rosa chinensis TaxID=74649 RepID=A0A2P6S5S8_ROSCH|nr:putative glutathione synthase [Rosa chinensis]
MKDAWVLHFPFLSPLIPSPFSTQIPVLPYFLNQDYRTQYVFKLNPTNQIFKTQLKIMSQPSQVLPANGGKVVARETQDESSTRPINVDGIDQGLVDKIVYDALVWSSIHGLIVGDRSVQRSSAIPGVGMDSLSRMKKADPFTSRLLDTHAKMLENNKKEEIRLGLHRSDYMLDEQSKLLLQT